MKRAAVPLACLLLLASLAATGGAFGAPVSGPVSAAAADGHAPAASGPELTLTQQDFDRTEFTVTVYANGSADWTFTFRRGLDNESERSAFEDYADRFNTEETQLYTDFVSRADQLTAQGSNVTGRSMDATAFSKRAYVDEGLVGEGDERGVVEMSFRWRNFARTDGDRVIVDDVFDGGFYIGPNQALVVAHGPALGFADIDPTPTSMSNSGSLADSDSVTWEGERSFNDNRPSIVLGPAGEASGDGTAPPGGDGLGTIPWLALAAVLLLGVGAAYVYRTGALESGGDGDAAVAATPDISDEELLTDEDRVVSMLEERGGRMKQVNIVEETGWSKSKVSMLLSDMEEEERVSKLRVGRENIVSLAGEEPEAAGSPFDDDDEE